MEINDVFEGVTDNDLYHYTNPDSLFYILEQDRLGTDEQSKVSLTRDLRHRWFAHKEVLLVIDRDKLRSTYKLNKRAGDLRKYTTNPAERESEEQTSVPIFPLSKCLKEIVIAENLLTRKLYTSVSILKSIKDYVAAHPNVKFTVTPFTSRDPKWFRNREVQESTEYTKYTIKNTDYLRVGFWYQPSSNTIIDAYTKNHAEVVAKEPERFGISKEEIAKVKQHKDFEFDWNQPVISLANAHGWVRVKIERSADSKNQTVMDLQSKNKEDVWKTAKRFVDEFSPDVVLIDFDIESYDNWSWKRLEGKQIDTYLRTKRFSGFSTRESFSVKRKLAIWYQPSSDSIIQTVLPNKIPLTHSEVLVLNPEKFGISREEINEIKKQKGYNIGWSEPVISLANSHGWVRVIAEEGADMQIQSKNKEDVWKTAKRFYDEILPVILYIDFNIEDYSVWCYTKLEGKQIETYLKTKRILSPSLTESALPMDEASRMKRAEALGFTIHAYHGTNMRFNEFDLEKGEARGNSAGHAPYFADKKAEATGYAKMRKKEGSKTMHVLHVLLRIKNPYDMNFDRPITAAEYKKIVGCNPESKWDCFAGHAIRDLKKHIETSKGLHGKFWFELEYDSPDWHKRMADRDVLWDKIGGQKAIWNEIYKKLIKLGYDGIVDSKTPGDHSAGYYKKYVVFDPKNIRSVEATFDPSQSESRNLMA